VDETPVFVREGAVIPEQSVSEYSDAKPLDTLILNVYGSGKSSFDLYEDDGISLAYAEGQYAHTAMTYASGSDGSHQLVIEPTRGAFQGQVQARSYELRIHATDKPSSISVNGRDAGSWRWEAERATAVVAVPSQPIRERISVAWR